MRRWARRAVTIPAVTVAWAVTLVLSPALVLVALVWDVVSGGVRLARTRTLAFFVLFLSCEVVGLVVALALWPVGVAGRARVIAVNAALQRWWTGALWRGARWLYSMSVHTDGLACAANGPYLLFVRHVSTADTVLPATMLANRFRIVFRYVLKKELLWDPCLDVVGNRLPNVFVDRSGSVRDHELAAIRRITANLGARDGVLIYPEGTRFSPRKLERARARLADAAPPEIAAAAAALSHTLPPRKGGPLALLDAAPGLDVVFFAHTGLEGARSFAHLVRGGLVGSTIHVRCWRVAAADIPTDPDARLRWLFARWSEVDRWVGARTASAGRTDEARRGVA